MSVKKSKDKMEGALGNFLSRTFLPLNRRSRYEIWQHGNTWADFEER